VIDAVNKNPADVYAALTIYISLLPTVLQLPIYISSIISELRGFVHHQNNYFSFLPQIGQKEILHELSVPSPSKTSSKQLARIDFLM
jgi:hypothetical protein